MKKSAKNRSETFLTSSLAIVKDVVDKPMDTLLVKIQSLRLNDEEPKHFAIKVTFFDQLIFSGLVKSIGARENIEEKTIAQGSMIYDPENYEKMCLFANYPLVVNIQPLKCVDSTPSSHTTNTPGQSLRSHTSSNLSGSFLKPVADISCCNVDILPLFQNQVKMYVSKRMRPLIEVPLLKRKSWDNLPLLTMELSVILNKANDDHHKLFEEANYFKVTVLGSYNMLFPFDGANTYTAATRSPMHNDVNTTPAIFNYGSQTPKRFNWNEFYPKWESLRLGGDFFTFGDEKFVSNFKDLLNKENINLAHYFCKEPSLYTTVWGSFHRTLLLKDMELWLLEHSQKYLWPFEIRINGEHKEYSFMAFLNLSNLLYPGENIVRLAVPLQWINSELMMEKCGCETILTSNEKVVSTATSTQKPSKVATDYPPTNTEIGILQPTGIDDSNAFIIVEVKLARPLKKITIPPHIHKADIAEMLKKMEENNNKRECTGRGQLDINWQSTVRIAANFLKRVPYYGMTEFCALIRQLSETRTHVELSTSFWQDAAVYINNNFVVREYLKSDDLFEEMIMMSHACLMRVTFNTLVGGEVWTNLNPTLIAARNARQMQDTSHAANLFFKLVVEKPREANVWRELSTCLKDMDNNWANICLNKSIVLNPRHPLTILCKGCEIFEEDMNAAEPFFKALLALYPFWSTAWTIASVYYTKRELFYMADTIMDFKNKTQAEGLSADLGYPRAWNRELGDWWDHTPLLPGISVYYDAADLLLRIRAISLAEMCVARGLSEAGESAVYFHLLALCCRLRGNIDDALCHINTGLTKYGEISYLRSLEAECFHKQNKIQEAMASYNKSGSCLSAYNILLSLPSRELQRTRSVLVDLVRRQPSAYTWMALADDWLMRFSTGEGGDAGLTEEQEAAKTCAAACAVQALKWDRMAGRAWALLAKLVKTSSRRYHCIYMANLCGYNVTHHQKESKSASQQTICHRLDIVLKECRCKWSHDFKL